MTENAEGLLEIGKLVLQFARVNRVTFHEDGVTPESDADHTIMVAVCACALAERLYKDELDIGLVAQFAIVHDLVEAYAGDVDTFGVSEAGKAEKQKREYESFLRIQKQFSEIYPWLPKTIEQYEALDSKEARFVKTVDKLMTKVTHILNRGAYFRGRNLSRDRMWNDYQSVTRDAEVKYGAEFPEIVALIDESVEEARKRTYGS